MSQTISLKWSINQVSSFSLRTLIRCDRLLIINISGIHFEISHYSFLRWFHKVYSFHRNFISSNDFRWLNTLTKPSLWLIDLFLKNIPFIQTLIKSLPITLNHLSTLQNICISFDFIYIVDSWFLLKSTKIHRIMV